MSSKARREQGTTAAQADADPMAETMVVFRFVKVRANKGVTFILDRKMFGTMEKEAAWTARASGNVVSDKIGAKSIGPAEAQVIADKSMAVWYVTPEGGVRTAADPFLNEMRNLAVRTGRLTTTKAREATEAGLREVFGAEAWAIGETRVRAKMERDAQEYAEMAEAVNLAGVDAPEGAKEDEA